MIFIFTMSVPSGGLREVEVAQAESVDQARRFLLKTYRQTPWADATITLKGTRP